MTSPSQALTLMTLGWSRRYNGLCIYRFSDYQLPGTLSCDIASISRSSLRTSDSPPRWTLRPFNHSQTTT